MCFVVRLCASIRNGQKKTKNLPCQTYWRRGGVAHGGMGINWLFGLGQWRFNSSLLCFSTSSYSFFFYFFSVCHSIFFSFLHFGEFVLFYFALHSSKSPKNMLHNKWWYRYIIHLYGDYTYIFCMAIEWGPCITDGQAKPNKRKTLRGIYNLYIEDI